MTTESAPLQAHGVVPGTLGAPGGRAPGAARRGLRHRATSSCCGPRPVCRWNGRCWSGGATASCSRCPRMRARPPARTTWRSRRTLPADRSACAAGSVSWLDAALFERELLRSGVIARRDRSRGPPAHPPDRVRHLEGSPLAEEVDADPEYQDWIRDVIEPARVLASEAKPARPRGSSWSVVHQLAAALAVLAIGLSVWVVQLRREVDLLSEPVFNVPLEDVVVGGTTRGDRTIEVPRDATRILLLLGVDFLIEAPEGRFEIVDRQEKTVWRSRSLVPLTPGSEFPVILPRHMLPDGLYRIRLLPASGDSLGEEVLKVETR